MGVAGRYGPRRHLAHIRAIERATALTCRVARRVRSGMTDDELRAIFHELQRIGADLGRPPGLALGTGFRPGEFLAWLQSLPDAIGHDAFATLLTERVTAAAQEGSLPDPPDREPTTRRSPFPVPGSPFPVPGSPVSLDLETIRFWPTREQLEAAIDILVREWDPLGARLGELTREVVEQHAFDVLGGLVRLPPAWHHETLVAVQLGQIEEDAFLVRKSPIEQRLYLARRLCAVVDSMPAPPLLPSRAQSTRSTRRDGRSTISVGPRRVRRGVGVNASSLSLSSCVSIGPTGHEPPALDPKATCEVCGKTGTVAFVTREIEPLVSQFCRECWGTVRWWAWFSLRSSKPEAPADMIALFDLMNRLEHEQIRSAGSAVWEDHFELVTRSLTPPHDESEDDAVKRTEGLRRFAKSLASRATEMDGPMPPKVEAFVRDYGGFDT